MSGEVDVCMHILQYNIYAVVVGCRFIFIFSFFFFVLLCVCNHEVSFRWWCTTCYYDCLSDVSLTYDYDDNFPMKIMDW